MIKPGKCCIDGCTAWITPKHFDASETSFSSDWHQCNDAGDLLQWSTPDVYKLLCHVHSETMLWGTGETVMETTKRRWNGARTLLTHTPKHTTKRLPSVYSGTRETLQPIFNGKGLKLDSKQKMDGLHLLAKLEGNSIPLVFFDHQYRTILDKQQYGNEGKSRQKARSALPQMNPTTIQQFLAEMERVLIPSGHLMLWVDKYILCSGIPAMMNGRHLQLVDMITWNKGRMGMGYRTRRYSEYLVIFQKCPIRAKGVWRVHDIPDVIIEKIAPSDKTHTHTKPVGLQKRLIAAVTNVGDIVVDPAAGGYSVMRSALEMNRHFVGCDILG